MAKKWHDNYQYFTYYQSILLIRRGFFKEFIAF